MATLDPDGFDEREWVALNWTRTFLQMQGDVPVRTEEEFCAVFSPRERGYILATHKAMYVANLSGNTMQGWLNRLRGRKEEAHTSCELRL